MLRNAVTTLHFAAIAIRSCSRQSLLTAAAISGVTPGASAASTASGGLVGEKPVAKAADGQMRNGRKGRSVMAVDDEPGDLVAFVSDDGLVEERRERQVGERILRGDALLAGLRRDPGELIAAAQRRGLGQQRFEIGERIAAGADRRAIHREVLT